MKCLLFIVLLCTIQESCHPHPVATKAVSIDFSTCNEVTTISFVGDQGQGTFDFISSAGSYQTHSLPDYGTYAVNYAMTPTTPNSCAYWFDSGALVVAGTGGSTSEAAQTLKSNYSFSVSCR